MREVCTKIRGVSLTPLGIRGVASKIASCYGNLTRVCTQWKVTGHIIIASTDHVHNSNEIESQL